jgi:hypothetical protein
MTAVPLIPACAGTGSNGAYKSSPHLTLRSVDASFEKSGPEVLAEIAIHREFNPVPVNRILNDPDVFPLIAVPGLEKFDITPQIRDPANYFLCVEGGCIVFMPDLPGSGLYEVHTNFLPAHRGRYAVRASLEAYRWMFTRTDCMMLQTRVPAFNVAASRFCGVIGATLWFERKSAWTTSEGHAYDLKFYTLSYMDWTRKHPEPLIASGRRFHDRLTFERERLGHPEPEVHPDEECHDLHVGACAEMIYGGQPEKAVQVYNRWARFAGYGQIALLQRNPLVIDIGDCVLLVADGNFRVITCRNQ